MGVLRLGIRVALLVLLQHLVLPQFLHPQLLHLHQDSATTDQMVLVLPLIVLEVQKEVHGVTRVALIVRNAVDVGAHLPLLVALPQYLLLLLQQGHHLHQDSATTDQMVLVLPLIVLEVQKEVHGVTRVALIVRNAVDVGVLKEERGRCLGEDGGHWNEKPVNAGVLKSGIRMSAVDRRAMML